MPVADVEVLFGSLALDVNPTVDGLEREATEFSDWLVPRIQSYTLAAVGSWPVALPWSASISPRTA